MLLRYEDVSSGSCFEFDILPKTPPLWQSIPRPNDYPICKRARVYGGVVRGLRTYRPLVFHPSDPDACLRLGPIEVFERDAGRNYVAHT